MVGKQPLKITEKELRKIIREYITEAISTPSFFTLFKKNRLSELPDINLLNEGVFKSYDVSFVVRYLNEKLNFTTDQIKFANHKAEGFIFCEDDYNNECDNINVVIPVSYKRIDELQKIMSACGYTLSHSGKIENDLFQQLEYEKNVQNEVRGLVGKYKYIYHLTPSVYVNKIMKQGLVPKSTNTFLNYTPRIYFLLDKKTINYGDVARILYNRKIDDTELLDNQEIKNKTKDEIEKYKSEYTLLRIKTSNIIGKVKFYIDNNLPNSVYVTENISPEYIEIDTTGIKVNE